MDFEAPLQPAPPPTIVLEQPAPCAESAQDAAAAFATALPVTAGDPLAGWSIHVRVASVGHDAMPTLRADGELTDARGVSIAHRSFTNRGTTCAPLARAIGIWASLALDDERAKIGPDSKPAVVALPPEAPKKHRPGAEDDDVDPDLRPNYWQKQNETRELGVAAIVEGGIGSRPMFGPAIYGVMDLGESILLRPTIAFDSSFASDQAIHGGTRVDLCGRLRGNYHAQKGLDAELCLGSEMGFLRAEGDTIPLLAVGPALGLQGELASNFAVTLRGVGEINLLRDKAGGSAPETLGGRAEVGVTWKLQ
ncbi:MAG: hypothetical protein ABI551_21915 [Polyangiaceae bacterium]